MGSFNESLRKDLSVRLTRFGLTRGSEVKLTSNFAELADYPRVDTPANKATLPRTAPNIQD